MNKTLELEAAQYAEDEIKDRGAKNDKLICKIDFMAGATSTYVEKQKLEFAIRELMRVNILILFEHQCAKDCIDNKIKELEQKLYEIQTNQQDNR